MTDEEIRNGSKRANRNGLPLILRELKESKGLVEFSAIYEQILENILENELRAENLRRESLPTIILAPRSQNDNLSLKEDLESKLGPRFKIEVNPTSIQLFLSSLIENKSAELVITDTHYEQELPDYVKELR